MTTKIDTNQEEVNVLDDAAPIKRNMLDVFLEFNEDKTTCGITIRKHNSPPYNNIYTKESTWENELEKYILPDYQNHLKIRDAALFTDIAASVRVRFDEKCREAFNCKEPEMEEEPAVSGPDKDEIVFEPDPVDEFIRTVNDGLGIYNAYGEKVFIKNGQLCEVMSDEQGNILICEVTPQRLAIILSTVYNWVKLHTDKDGYPEMRPCQGPNRELLKTVLAAGVNYQEHTGFWKAPPLKNVVSGVLLTPEGEVISKKGYCPNLQVYLCCDYEVEDIPLHPSDEDVGRAKQILFDPFSEFQFAYESEGEKSAGCVSVLTNYQNTVLAAFLGFLRATVPGPFPIVLISKTSRGIGGTLLPVIISRLTSGMSAFVTPSSPEGSKNDAQYMAMVNSGCRFGVLDNVEPGSVWATETLLSATSGSGKIITRQYHSLSMLMIDVQTFFVINGVNVANFEDAVRRILPVRLSAPVSYTEVRYKRSREELEALSSDLHPKAAWAFAVLIRRWRDLGSSRAEVPGIANEYRELYGFACGVLRAAGFEHVLENLEGRLSGENEADAEFVRMVSALDMWSMGEEGPGGSFTSHQLSKKLLELGGCRREGKFESALLDAFPDFVVERALKGSLTSRSVSRALGLYVDKKVRGCNLTLKKCVGHAKGEETRYSVEPVQVQSVLV